MPPAPGVLVQSLTFLALCCLTFEFEVKLVHPIWEGLLFDCNLRLPEMSEKLTATCAVALLMLAMFYHNYQEIWACGVLLANLARFI